MPHVTEMHAHHDQILVVSLASGDLATADRDRATALSLVESCGDCARLHDDVLAIAQATKALPAAVRTARLPDQPRAGRQAATRGLAPVLRGAGSALQPPARRRPDDARHRRAADRLVARDVDRRQRRERVRRTRRPDLRIGRDRRQVPGGRSGGLRRHRPPSIPRAVMAFGSPAASLRPINVDTAAGAPPVEASNDNQATRSSADRAAGRRRGRRCAGGRRRESGRGAGQSRSHRGRGAGRPTAAVRAGW